jgi:hypothetical protein
MAIAKDTHFYLFDVVEIMDYFVRIVSNCYKYRNDFRSTSLLLRIMIKIGKIFLLTMCEPFVSPFAYAAA